MLCRIYLIANFGDIEVIVLVKKRCPQAVYSSGWVGQTMFWSIVL